MRTTLSLDDDAVAAVNAYSEQRRISLGKAASELIRRGAGFQLTTQKRNGLPVFQVPDEFPLITSERVRELLEEP